jgi:UDP-glucose 4-epimerase
VVDAVSGLLIGRHAGQFNLAPDGLMTLRECAELLETPIRKMPLRLYRALAKVLWRLRMSEAPPGQIDFAIYPWIISNAKLKSTLGWSPKHTSRETFELTMRAQGKLPPSEPPVPAPEAAQVSSASGEPSESPTASRA